MQIITQKIEKYFEKQNSPVHISFSLQEPHTNVITFTLGKPGNSAQTDPT